VIKPHKILYVAKHNSGGNDDEGSILNALRSLGHHVQVMTEDSASRRAPAVSSQYDFVLCHKWHDLNAAVNLNCPMVFWYFDLVVQTGDDDSLKRRNRMRSLWMHNMTDLCAVGFVTDGNAVLSDATGKLIKLPQGADQRVVGMDDKQERFDLLFTGIATGAGKARASFVEELVEVYGDRFTHVPAGVYGRDLRRQISRHRIVVCPDSPVYPDYCSNRVYNALGFGAFVLHPRCAYLELEYENMKDIVFYHDRQHLHYLINYFLPREEERRAIAKSGMEATINNYTYRHRVEKLMEVVSSKLVKEVQVD
jgi:hypothetical protein